MNLAKYKSWNLLMMEQVRLDMKTSHQYILEQIKEDDSEQTKALKSNFRQLYGISHASLLEEGSISDEQARSSLLYYIYEVHYVAALGLSFNSGQVHGCPADSGALMLPSSLSSVIVNLRGDIEFSWTNQDLVAVFEFKTTSMWNPTDAKDDGIRHCAYIEKEGEDTDIADVIDGSKHISWINYNSYYTFSVCATMNLRGCGTPIFNNKKELCTRFANWSIACSTLMRLNGIYAIPYYHICRKSERCMDLTLLGRATYAGDTWSSQESIIIPQHLNP